MEARKSVILIILILSVIPVFGIKISLAPLNIYSTEKEAILQENEMQFVSDLYRKMIKLDITGKLGIINVSKDSPLSSKVPKSTLDAAEFCQILNMDYLIYGYVEKTNRYYNIELRIYDRERKEDRRFFYAKDDLEFLDEITNQLSLRIVSYLYQMIGLSLKEAKENKQEFGGIGIYTGAGYFIPFPEWWTVITGLFTVEHGIQIIPANYLAEGRNFSYFLRTGVIGTYAMSMNKPGILKSYYHGVQIRIPVENCFTVYQRNQFNFGIAPVLSIDTIYQERLYDDPYQNTVVAFGLNGTLGYEYWFGKQKNVSIGISNEFNIHFYDRVYMDYRIVFFNSVKIIIPADEKK